MAFGCTSSCLALISILAGIRSRYVTLIFPGRGGEITRFFGPDGSGRRAGVPGADGITGHHSELVLHPGVELHGHGRLHVSSHGVWVCTQNQGNGRYSGCGSPRCPPCEEATEGKTRQFCSAMSLVATVKVFHEFPVASLKTNHPL